jgi:hypothetical protein
LFRIKFEKAQNDLSHTNFLLGKYEKKYGKDSSLYASGEESEVANESASESEQKDDSTQDAQVFTNL